MREFSKTLIPVKCIYCDFENQVSIEQIKTEKVVICRGCRSNIVLKDYLKSVQKAERDLKKAVNDIEEALQKGFNFEIKL